MKTTWDAVNELRGDLSNSHMHRDFHEFLFYVSGGINKWVTWHDNEESADDKLICTIDEFNSLVAEMENNFGKTKPQYTQAMFEAGEKPSMGMEVAYGSNMFIVIGEADSNCDLALKGVSDNLYWIARASDIKPITPPIELIDGEIYEFRESLAGKVKGFYREDSCQFMTMNFGYIDVDNCTNIKPLTAKEEI